jgi:polar amino acid transport system ATP-binding protein
MVRFRNVTKRNGWLTVPENLDLDVAEGEMGAIIGPAGSGETTVPGVLMLARLQKGVSHVDVTPVAHRQRRGRRGPAPEQCPGRAREPIGVDFRHFETFPGVTALGNCREGRVQVLGLSGGQQQRVAIAPARRAAEGDAARRGGVRARSRGHRRSGAGDRQARPRPPADDAPRHAPGRLGPRHLRSAPIPPRGRIAQQETPEELFGNPRKQRTRQFLSAPGSADR